MNASDSPIRQHKIRRALAREAARTAYVQGNQAIKWVDVEGAP